MRNNKKIPLVFISLIAFWTAGCSDSDEKPVNNTELPIQTTFKIDEFSSAEDCRPCHPRYVEEWESSMHAYSTSDPLWMVLQKGRQDYHNANGVEIGALCFQCHAPVAFLTGTITDYSNITQATMDTLPTIIKEGITCTVCHAMTHLPKPTNIITEDENYATADYPLYMDGTQYGRLDEPIDNEFHESAFHPAYGKSEICQNCHNLQVNGVDAEVNQFEWEGTVFQAMGMECQTCHMPAYSGQAAAGGPDRDNLHEHYFPGVDEPVTNFPGIDAQHAAIVDLLNNSANINYLTEFPDTIHAGTDINLDIVVTNFAGHHFPSGVTFIRQLWLETLVIVGSDTLFSSGFLDENGDINDMYVDPGKTLDPQLKQFYTVLYNAAGDSGNLNVSVEQMAWMNDYTLPTNGSRQVHYSIPIPAEFGGQAVISSRLRFRAIPPFIYRLVGLDEYVDNLYIYDIDEIDHSVTLVP